MPLVSIIIVNFNSGSALRICLKTLQEQLHGLDYECCVVDNDSADSSLENLPALDHFTLIKNSANFGFAKAMNIGLEHTQGTYVMWLNPDTRVLDGDIQKVFDFFDQHPKVAIAGCRILNPNQKVQYSARSFPSYETSMFGRYSLITRWFPQNPLSRKYLGTEEDYFQPRPVDWVSGACLIHRRSLIESIGNLDEGYFMYCEDVDFCKRAKHEGWEVFYLPFWTVEHQIGGCTRKQKRKMAWEHHKSMWRYYKKHYSRHLLKDGIVGSAILLRGLFSFLFPPATES